MMRLSGSVKLRCDLGSGWSDGGAERRPRTYPIVARKVFDCGKRSMVGFDDFRGDLLNYKVGDALLFEYPRKTFRRGVRPVAYRDRLPGLLCGRRNST